MEKNITVEEVFAHVKAIASNKDRIQYLKEIRPQFNHAPVGSGNTLDMIFEASNEKHYLSGDHKDLSMEGCCMGWHSFEAVMWAVLADLKRLANRELTGKDAIEVMRNNLIALKPEAREILRGLLNNNLQIGVSYEAYMEKVVGKKVNLEVSLAEKIQDVKGVDVLDGTYYASRKCDGCRCRAVVDFENKEVHFISRQNKEFTTLEYLKERVLDFVEPISHVGWGKIMLDGELCKVDDNGDEDFQAIMKEIRKKDYNITDCCYQLFDICTEDEWNGVVESPVFTDRYRLMKDLEDTYIANHCKRGCWIKVLEQEKVTGQDVLDRWQEKVEKYHWEGYMLRKDVTFFHGRSKYLLKVKGYHDEEYVVEGYETGDIATQEPGQGIQHYTGVTNLFISHKGYKVSVGSGLTKAQRKEWMADPSKIMGKTITVQYFQETKDQNGNISLRFPRLKFVYENGRDL